MTARGVVATGCTRIHYSDELLAAVVEIESRDKSVEAWHARLAQLMTYDVAVREAVATLADRFAEVLVCRAWTASEEGAEVSEGRSTLTLRILPMRFANPLRLERFLRHEVGHVTDVIDVTFGYAPVGLAMTRDLRRRFNLLWDCSIDGRIERAGGSALHAREEYHAEFVRVFPGLTSDLTEATVGQLWDGERPSYGRLVHLATEWAALAARREAARFGEFALPIHVWSEQSFW